MKGMVELLGKGIKGMANDMVVEVGRCWLVKCWLRRKGLMYGHPTNTATIGSTTHFN